MTNLLTGFHPSFDALSALADQSDTESARTRVGRHVARCAACAATVADIRSLGDAARAVEVDGPPADLWSRIEGARTADVFTAAPALRPTTHVPAPARRVARRAGIAVLATAAAVVGILMLPSPGRRTLSAAPDRGTWRFTPARPLPGASVRVRFEPPATLPAAERFLLLGRQLPPWTEPTGGGFFRGALADSVATLVRASDGSYQGTFVAPSAFVGVVLHLSPMGGGFFPVPRDTSRMPHAVDVFAGRPTALLVAGTPDGRPRLDALSSAALSGGDWGVGSAGLRYRVADTLIRYYPSEPIGYAVDRRIPGKRLVDDVIAWFNRGERQYAKFEQRLMKEPVVSIDRELAMMVFANRISEPGEAQRWVMRMVREHPRDPRTLLAYTMMMSARFNHPGAIELVRRELPLADSLYEQNGHRDLGGEMPSIAGRARDTAAYVRWVQRSWTADGPLVPLYQEGFDAAVLRELLVLPAARAFLEREAHRSCDLADGRYPLQASRAFVRAQCIARRRDRYADLALLARLDGEPRRALAYADTALSLGGFDEACWYRQPHLRRGEALLALRDTAGAVPELAWQAVGVSWQTFRAADSIGRALRPNVDSATWASATTRAQARLQACLAEQGARRKAESDSLRAAGAPPYYR